jgi:DNA primase large subunit
MSREAMQIALEALEKVTKHFTRTPSTLMDSEARVEAHNAITALRQALETKREWSGLTDDEIQGLSYLSQKIDEGNSPWFDRLGFAKAIEQALKEKNQ